MLVKLCSLMMVEIWCKSLSYSFHICSPLRQSILILYHCEETRPCCVCTFCRLCSNLYCLCSYLCNLSHSWLVIVLGSCVYPDCIASLTWDCKVVGRVTCCSETVSWSAARERSHPVEQVSWCSSCLVTSSPATGGPASWHCWGHRSSVLAAEAEMTGYWTQRCQT